MLLLTLDDRICGARMVYGTRCKKGGLVEFWWFWPLVALPAPPRLLLLHKLLLKRGNTDVSHKVVPGRGTLLNHLNQRGVETGRG